MLQKLGGPHDQSLRPFQPTVDLYRRSIWVGTCKTEVSESELMGVGGRGWQQGVGGQLKSLAKG